MNNTETEILALLDAPSQYPEFERKSRTQRENDLKTWLDKYGEVNVCYNLYGMDRADAPDCDAWLDMKTFGRQRWEVNSTFVPFGSNLKLDHTLIPRNKLLNEMFLSYWYGAESGVYIPTKALFLRDTFFTLSPTDASRMKRGEFRDFVKAHDNGQRFVFKEVFGGRGKQIVIAEVQDGKLVVEGKATDPDELARDICAYDATWIIQDYFQQHPDMARFNPSSVNTLRIVSYHVGSHALIGDVAVRMGHPGALVDNAYADGFYTNVDEEGHLDESLFNFSSKSRIIHDYQDAIIPGIKAARELCVELHELQPEIFSIGWDIAIAPNGQPTVVESNDGWAVFVTQTAWGHAGRGDWDRNLAEREAFMKAASQA